MVARFKLQSPSQSRPNPFFPKQMEQEFIKNFNNSQALAKKQGCKITYNEELRLWKIYLLVQKSS